MKQINQVRPSHKINKEIYQAWIDIEAGTRQLKAREVPKPGPNDFDLKKYKW
jgi:hypothetical protein